MPVGCTARVVSQLVAALRPAPFPPPPPTPNCPTLQQVVVTGSAMALVIAPTGVSTPPAPEPPGITWVLAAACVWTALTLPPALLGLCCCTPRLVTSAKRKAVWLGTTLGLLLRAGLRHTKRGVSILAVWLLTMIGDTELLDLRQGEIAKGRGRGQDRGLRPGPPGSRIQAWRDAGPGLQNPAQLGTAGRLPNSVSEGPGWQSARTSPSATPRRSPSGVASGDAAEGPLWGSPALGRPWAGRVETNHANDLSQRQPRAWQKGYGRPTGPGPQSDPTSRLDAGLPLSRLMGRRSAILGNEVMRTWPLRSESPGGD